MLDFGWYVKGSGMIHYGKDYEFLLRRAGERLLNIVILSNETGKQTKFFRRNNK
jgi:hypothetical protein